jgi:hypothetical protein
VHCKQFAVEMISTAALHQPVSGPAHDNRQIFVARRFSPVNDVLV